MVTDQIKADTRSSVDSHTRFHDRDWLDVEDEDYMPTSLRGAPRLILCRCACGNPVYVFSNTVKKRREKR